MQPTSSIFQPSDPPLERAHYQPQPHTHSLTSSNTSALYQQAFQSLQHAQAAPLAYSSRAANTMRDDSGFFANMGMSANAGSYVSGAGGGLPHWQPHYGGQFGQSLGHGHSGRSHMAISIPAHPTHNHSYGHHSLGHSSPGDSPSSSASLSPAQSAPTKSRAPRFVDTFQARILKQDPHANSEGEVTPAKPKRKRRTPVVDPTTKLVRSQKHNEAEVRRRQRLNNLLLELAELVQCKKPQKSAILRITIEKCRQWHAKVKQLEDRLAAYEKPGGISDTQSQPLSLSSPMTSSMASLAESTSTTSSMTPSAFDSLSSQSQPQQQSPSPIPIMQPIYPTTAIDAFTIKEENFGAGGVAAAGANESESLSIGTIGDLNVSSTRTVHASACAVSIAPTHFSAMSYQHAVNIMADATVAMDLVDLNGRILACNQLFADFTGYSKQELLDPQATFFNITHPDSLNASFSLLSGLITANHSVGRTMKKYVHKTGRVRAALLTAFMVNDLNGQANYVVTILEPVETDAQGL